MGHQAVREFIEAKATGLNSSVVFGYGRGSDFNQIKDKGYPFIWLDPLSSTVNLNEDNLNITETFNINLIFYKFDAPDSIPDDYKLILDETYTLVQQFVRDVHVDLVNYDDTLTLSSSAISITGLTVSPFIKIMADCLTGFTLSFSLTVPDNFDYDC